MQKEELYNKIFDTLEDYVINLIPLKNIEDPELIKQCSLFETYEVGKLDQVDILDKRMILIGISRKLFVHSLPLVVAEKCYIKLLKDTRNLIVDTKIARKSYRISHLVAFLNLIMCVLKKMFVFDQFEPLMDPEPDFDLFTFAGPL